MGCLTADRDVSRFLSRDWSWAVAVILCAATGWVILIVTGMKKGFFRWETLLTRQRDDQGRAVSSVLGSRWLPIVLMLILAGGYFLQTREYWPPGGTDDRFSHLGRGSAEKAYQDFKVSQYVVGWQEGRFRLMWDQEIYSVAGWLYAHGTSPSVVNPEHPPLGKYLIGAGSRFLANPVIVPLLAGLLAILLFFSFASDALGDPVSGFAVAAVLSSTKLFQVHVTETFLEGLVLAAMIAGVWLLGRLSSGKGNPLVLLLALVAVTGFGVAAKWPVVVLIAVSLVFFALIRRYDWMWAYGAMLPAAALIYLSSYSAYFVAGHSLGDFAALQFSMLHRWQTVWEGTNQPLFTIWQILFTGYCEYGDRVTPLWQWHWPVAGAGAGLALAYAVWNRAPRLWLSLLWFFGYLLFFSTGPTWDRYLLPALPGALLATAWLLKDSGAALLGLARRRHRAGKARAA